jgi:hypothetical protein
VRVRRAHLVARAEMRHGGIFEQFLDSRRRARASRKTIVDLRLIGFFVGCVMRSCARSFVAVGAALIASLLAAAVEAAPLVLVPPATFSNRMSCGADANTRIVRNSSGTGAIIDSCLLREGDLTAGGASAASIDYGLGATPTAIVATNALGFTNNPAAASRGGSQGFASATIAFSAVVLQLSPTPFSFLGGIPMALTIDADGAVTEGSFASAFVRSAFFGLNEQYFTPLASGPGQAQPGGAIHEHKVFNLNFPIAANVSFLKNALCSSEALSNLRPADSNVFTKCDLSVDPFLSFDQEEFDRRFGARSFSLADFFSIELSDNLFPVAAELGEPRLIVLLVTGVCMIAFARRTRWWKSAPAGMRAHTLSQPL